MEIHHSRWLYPCHS